MPELVMELVMHDEEHRGRPLPPHLADRAARLVAAGASYKAVARRLGIHHTTVSKIVKQQLEPPPVEIKYHRCHGCGGMVELPCRLCALRAGRS